MSCTLTITLGGYLLGALEPEERSVFEGHLHGCDQCRAELVRLAPLPGLLHQITLADFADQPPAPRQDLPHPVWEPEPAAGEPTDSTEPTEPTVPADHSTAAAAQHSHPATRSQRGRYWLVAAAAAIVVALTVGGVIGYRALFPPTAQPQSVSWSATDPGSGVTADARLIDRGWGTEVWVRLSELPPGKTCKLVVWDNYGHRETAGWWSTYHDPADQIPGSTSVDLRHIDRLEVITDDDTLLVSVRPPA